jgi:5-methyltetrahydrofolate--homocysteine methyltransferase
LIRIAEKITKRAAQYRIVFEDIVIDSLAMSKAVDSKAGWVTLEIIRLLGPASLAISTLGASNILFGLPDRK